MKKLVVIVSLVLLAGCASKQVRCDAHLKPINWRVEWRPGNGLSGAAAP